MEGSAGRGVRTVNRSVGRKKEKTEYFFDYTLLVVILFLLGFGLLMIYSASYYEAYLEFGGDSFHYVKRQLLAIVLGLICMSVVAFIPYHFWERFAMAGYIVSLILIVMVKSPIGITSGGATRWIGIPGTALQVQPAEIAKLCMILFMACMVCKIGRNVRTIRGFLFMIILPLPHTLLVWQLTNNLSSAIIIFGIALLMIFVADPHYKKYLLLAGLAVAGVAAVIYMIYTGQLNEGFRIERVAAWINPEAYASGKGYQTLQALYAIGSGGIWGKGLGQSIQKLTFLPEAQNDMIFSIICEELGLFGAIAVILLFAVLIWRMMIIANNASDLFGAMLVVGVIAHISIQVILNIAVVTNTIPNTGISLPFISYGGSSVMFLLIEMGLVLSVSRGIALKETK